jgi:hypothetical protein
LVPEVGGVPSVTGARGDIQQKLTGPIGPLVVVSSAEGLRLEGFIVFVLTIGPAVFAAGQEASA